MANVTMFVDPNAQRQSGQNRMRQRQISQGKETPRHENASQRTTLVAIAFCKRILNVL
jgi:hypothetical protein